MHSLRSLVCDLVIATTEELYKTEPMTKGIGHKRQLTPFVCGDWLLKPGASLHGIVNFLGGLQRCCLV
jgi:hypothetical protein